MINNWGFSVKDAVEKRYSVRTFTDRKVTEETKEQILAYARGIENPFGPKVNYQWIERETAANGEKLGTYGIIKGASQYLGTTVAVEEGYLEGLGYEVEQLVLYLTSSGLGTCWLGGTFNRSAFAENLEIKDNEVFPILTPVGYVAEKLRIAERVFRMSIKADKRVGWENIFFADRFDIPLTKEAAGDYAYPLEMVRLAPSAVNMQPWRVVYDGKAFHFFEKKKAGAGEGTGVDMQRIDVGIALCHFHLAAMEKSLRGRFEKAEKFDFSVPESCSYVISWILE